jgi:Ax21 family sulfation-dependent quorum factor
MKRSLFALALMALLPLSAQAADDLSYTYVELGYNWASLDGTDSNPDGFSLKGSAALGSSFYAFGSYFQGSDELDDLGGDVDLDLDYDQLQLGLGYRHAMNDSTDFLAELSYINGNVEVEGFDDADADGYRASVGVRGAMSSNFEGYAKANWTDGSDVDGDFSGTIGAQYKFNDMWGITAEGEFGNDASIYGIGVRASF